MSDEDKALEAWWSARWALPVEQADPEVSAFRAGWAAGVAAVRVAKILPAVCRPVCPITEED